MQVLLTSEEAMTCKKHAVHDFCVSFAFPENTGLFTGPYLAGGGLQSLTFDLGFLSLASFALPESHQVL